MATKSEIKREIESNLLKTGRESHADARSEPKICVSNLQEKLYHGTTTTWGENTFWVYSPHLKLQNNWDTHLSVSTYCNHHKQHDENTFQCLGHTNSDDFIYAQKEWEKNGWTEEKVDTDSGEIFVGKKSYIYNK